uniref:BOS complex subunit NCLN n=1 Tax=Ascaris lumbricoides TaxID=6252 RepID=A0A0M3HPJ1_ASCLU
MHEELLEALRNPFVFVYVSMLLSWYVVSGTQLGDAVEMELKAYRLQQYDLVGTPHGSRASKVLYEAVSLDGNTLRRCVVVGWRELLGRDLQTLFDQAVGGVIIIIPADLDALSPAHRAVSIVSSSLCEPVINFASLERSLLALDTHMAVYVTRMKPELHALIKDVSLFSQKASSAVHQLVNAIAANTFQFSSSPSVSNHLIVPSAANVMARLWAADRSSPVIVLVAHYDTHSAVPALSTGSDSNGSGIATLIELLAIFSTFYSNATTKPKYNMIFLLTAGGKFNYQGSRQWIEDHIEKQIEENVEMVICLDTLGKGNGLIMHVSKMPSETAPAGRMFARLKTATPPNRTVDITSKKINLNAETLAWEHERYSIRRLPAFTLSRLTTHTDPIRTSLLDSPKQLDLKALEANVRTISEAILAHIFELPSTHCAYDYNVSTCSILAKRGVEPARLAYWVKRFGSMPRPIAGDSQALVADLAETYANGRASVEPVSVVDISLYGALEDRLTAHRVKPAVFELLLAACIALYLSAVYLCALNVHSLVESVLAKLKKV